MKVPLSLLPLAIAAGVVAGLALGEPPAPGHPADTAAQVEAHAQARALVDAAIAAGRWDRRDALSLRQLLALQSPDQREDVIHTLLPALNSGQVRVETGPMPPF